jgi:hypothetical protein
MKDMWNILPLVHSSFEHVKVIPGFTYLQRQNMEFPVSLRTWTPQSHFITQFILTTRERGVDTSVTRHNSVCTHNTGTWTPQSHVTTQCITTRDRGHLSHTSQLSLSQHGNVDTSVTRHNSVCTHNTGTWRGHLSQT